MSRSKAFSLISQAAIADVAREKFWAFFSRCESQQTSVGGVDDGAVWTISTMVGKKRAVLAKVEA